MNRESTVQRAKSSNLRYRWGDLVSTALCEWNRPCWEYELHLKVWASLDPLLMKCPAYDLAPKDPIPAHSGSLRITPPSTALVAHNQRCTWASSAGPRFSACTEYNNIVQSLRVEAEILAIQSILAYVRSDAQKGCGESRRTVKRQKSLALCGSRA